MSVIITRMSVIITRMSVMITRMSVTITRMIIQITSRVPKSHPGCQNQTQGAKITCKVPVSHHDVIITLVRVV
jgi:hypothetical protein